MYIDKLIKKEVITLLISVVFLVVVFIGVTFAKFLSVDKGEKTVINMGDLNISFCSDSSCDTTYSNIGQVIGTKVENGVTVPASIYPFKDNGSYSNETPYIFKIENTGTLDSTVKIKLKEDATYTPTGDYSSYTRLSLKYPEHLKVAIRKKVTFEDTGYQLGDVNMDGIVDYKDVDLLSRYLAKYQGVELSDFQKKLANLNSDSKISGVDGQILARLIAGWETIPAGIEPFYIYSYTDLEDGVIFKDDIIKAGESATYFLWLYLDKSTPNDVQNTFFVGNIDVEGEYIPENMTFCTTNNELTDGVTYVNGQYTYTYTEDTNDWSVKLTDSTSTDPVTSDVCTYINSRPITSMASMFADSQASSINISNVNSSSVTNMMGMFNGSAATSIIGLENLDTSNVTQMVAMFAYTNVTSLNLRNFNTSNVKGMGSMFMNSKVEVLDLSSFDTSNVTSISNMFSGSQVKTIYVGDFDTSSLGGNITPVFANCTNLVGGEGTSFATVGATSKSYAKVDSVASGSGYFTSILDKSAVEPSSFATDSWATISKAIRSGNTSVYKVGDTRTLDLEKNGRYTIRISNISTPDECSSSNISQSACGFVVEFADIMVMNVSRVMNDTATNEGRWGSSKLRTTLNKTIYDILPKELRFSIIETKTLNKSTSGSNTVFSSTYDKLYLLAPGEVWAIDSSNSISYDVDSSVVRQLDYYKEKNVTTTNYSGAIKKDSLFLLADHWWLRSASSNDSKSFFKVNFEGKWETQEANVIAGISPAFRIG